MAKCWSFVHLRNVSKPKYISCSGLERSLFNFVLSPDSVPVSTLSSFKFA